MLEELLYLKIALKDYQASRWMRFIDYFYKNTYSGFCHYFKNTQKIDFNKNNFPTLYKLKPSTKNMY